MGRSTGKLFKEKGVSLYKDKEISTTHAKVQMCVYVIICMCIRACVYAYMCVSVYSASIFVFPSPNFWDWD